MLKGGLLIAYQLDLISWWQRRGPGWHIVALPVQPLFTHGGPVVILRRWACRSTVGLLWIR